MKIEKIKEGKTEFFIHKSKDKVFYNPVMRLARDLSVIITSTYQKIYKKQIKFGDALSATGVRGVRIGNEVQNTQILLNDKNSKAFKIIKKNIQLNNLKNAKAFNKDANIFILENRPLDVLDIDPFGSPVPFLDTAVRGLYKEGLLCVTATDLPVLVGLYPQTSYRRYGVRNFKTEYFEELGLRVLLSYISRTAAKYDFYIKPLISHATDHYMRVYCSISHGVKKANNVLENLGYLLHCEECGYRKLSNYKKEKCPNCSNKLKIIENIWIGDIENEKFCKAVLKENENYNFSRESNKLLRILLKDSKSPPLYYNIHKVCKRLKINSFPTDKLINILKNKGFIANRTHFGKGFNIKTNANIKQLKDILRTKK